jgi:hypothetical protein
MFGRICRQAAVVALLSGAVSAWGAEPPRVERFLKDGKLADGERELAARLESHPDDDQNRFELGTLRFLRAVERLGQSLYQYGALGPESRLGRMIPILRIAVPKNPDPKQVRYADVRTIFQELADDLAAAEATLKPIQDDRVKLPLHFGLIRLDLNGDGNAGQDETLWRIYAGLNNGLRLTGEVTPPDAESFVIAFDYADVSWLRGYCHLLSALCETILAYDEQALFDAVAHHLFDKPAAPSVPQEILRKPDRPWEGEIADAIVAVHLAHFELKEPERMKAAHQHLEQVIALSRESWKAIGTETDDDREWIPGSKQTGIIPNVRVTAEMVGGWQEFLNEAEQILAGKKLVPHWRMNADHGINLRRVFHEPREFDLVFWAHGAAAVPYAEKGSVATGQTWQRLQQTFRGQFIGFAFWFN